MLRLPRHLVSALLWLTLALVPLRGWAAAMMPIAMALQTPATASAAADHAAPAAAHSMADTMPCHQGMEPAADESRAEHPMTHCAMCDLCHASVADAPRPPSLSAALKPDVPTMAVHAPIEARAPDALFRPPRPRLA